jgi:hypothetical protein
MINEQADDSDSAMLGRSSDLPVAISSEVQPSSQAETAVDEQLMRRIEDLPREAGWVLVTAGVIGVIAPGIMGVPFLVAGAFVLTPGGPHMLSRWAGRKPRKFAHSALRQICRLLDDLDRRYPHRPTGRNDTPSVPLEYRRNFDAQ